MLKMYVIKAKDGSVKIREGIKRILNNINNPPQILYFSSSEYSVLKGKTRVTSFLFTPIPQINTYPYINLLDD